MYQTKRFGYVPDLPDVHDYYYRAPERIELPSSVDLREKMPPVYDQGNLGSCTANAIAAAIEYNRVKQGLSDFVPSRLFIYYNERRIEHTIKEDAGAMIRDGIKSVVKQGACDEQVWPYDITKFSRRPGVKCYNLAKHDLVSQYLRLVQHDQALKTPLAQGEPFVFGFTVYESFMSKVVEQTGNVPMPGTSEAVIGGHAVLCVGYTENGRYIFRNSWGATWGDKGYGFLPAEYLLMQDLSADFWVIQQVSG
jgi:C1A family cysteine protease